MYRRGKSVGSLLTLNVRPPGAQVAVDCAEVAAILDEFGETGLDSGGQCEYGIKDCVEPIEEDRHLHSVTWEVGQLTWEYSPCARIGLFSGERLIEWECENGGWESMERDIVVDWRGYEIRLYEVFGSAHAISFHVFAYHRSAKSRGISLTRRTCNTHVSISTMKAPK